MLDRLRKNLASVNLVLGAKAATVSSSPMVWTLSGLFIAFLSLLAFSISGRTAGILGGLAVLGSGFFDVLDGAVARHANRVSQRGSFLDSTLDRLGEIFIFAGILLGGYSSPLVVLLALALSLLVSYTRAKADSLGINLAGVGVGERSERLVVIALASLLGLLSYGLVLVASLAAVTVAERVYRTALALPS